MRNFLFTLMLAPAFLAASNGISPDKQAEINKFLIAYPNSYQDVMVQNRVINRGSNICEPRYELIKPILDSYQKPFTVLDIGAAQGYFDFRIAHDYPHATCVMIDNNTSFGGNFGDMLFNLCHLNDDLNNIFYLRKTLNHSDIEMLVHHEHFDIVLAFLVIHQFPSEQQFPSIDSLLKLGDNVIIEVANNVETNLTDYVESLSKETDCVFMGELPRVYYTNENTGKFFWFRNRKENDQEIHRQGISQDTFVKLNGVYP